MQHEKIIKREDGTRIPIIVGFVAAVSFNEYRWFTVKGDLNATPFEILSAKLELWEKLKPTI